MKQTWYNRLKTKPLTSGTTIYKLSFRNRIKIILACLFSRTITFHWPYTTIDNDYILIWKGDENE